MSSHTCWLIIIYYNEMVIYNLSTSANSNNFMFGGVVRM